MKKSLLIALLALALPLWGQETQPATQPEAEEEAKETPTVEELAGKLEALTEAFTESRNSLEILNRLRIAGYIQAEYVHSDASQNQLTGPTATRNLDTFRVRRGRINFQYQFLPTGRFVLQPDLSSSGVALRDAYIEIAEPWTSWRHTATVGQFKWPFGYEVRQSSRDREMPERTLVVRTLFPGERDRGLQMSGAGFGERFNYRIGVFNGNGTSTDRDLNKRKDIVGRVGVNLGALDLGVSGYNGAEIVPLASTGNPPLQGEFEKDRWGIDVQWVTPLPGLGVRGEYIRGTQPPNANAGASARTADVDGWYVYLVQNLGTKHQFVLRADQYDPNVDTDNNSTRTLGGSYIFHYDPNIKVMFAYEQPRLENNDPDDDLATIRVQYTF